MNPETLTLPSSHNIVMLTIFPVELCLDILEYLKPQENDVPAIGSNSCWTKLTSVVKLPPTIVTDEEEIEPWATAMKAREKGAKEPCALWKLRQTCKAMNNICAPMLFHSINLIERDPESFLSVPIRYADHIRELRVLVDPFVLSRAQIDAKEEVFDQTEKYQAEVVELIKASRNLSSIGLYFRSAGTSMEGIVDSIVHNMHLGRIQLLGVYSLLVLHRDIGDWAWNSIQERSSCELFDALIRNPKATKSLKALDIATTTIHPTAYDTLRAHFPSLESFTIRRSLRSHLGRIWDPNEQSKWHPKQNLTRLHIIDCLAAYAPHIPELVRHFKALKYLLVSTCGSWEDEYPPPRPTGWRMKPDALYDSRRLDVAHVEHMAFWEILALGIIPTRKLILSNIQRGDFIGAVQADSDIFPHLETLSLVPTAYYLSIEANGRVDHPTYEEDNAILRSLQAWAKDRGVKIDFEGFVIKDGGGSFGFA